MGPGGLAVTRKPMSHTHGPDIPDPDATGTPYRGTAALDPSPRLAPPGRVTLVEGRYLANTGPSSAGWHELAEAVLCLQKWAGHNILKLTAPPRDYLTRGTLLHAGLGAHYLAQWAAENNQDPSQFWEAQQAVEVQAGAMEDELARRGANHTAQSLVLAVQKALWAHQYHYGALDRDRYAVIGVELEFEAVIAKDPNDLSKGVYRLTRGVDLVLYDRMTGGVVIVDHKGRGGRSNKTESMYENDLTMTALWKFGTREWGDKFQGVILNYVTVPKAGARDVTVHMDRVTAKRAPWLEREIPRTVRYYRERIAECMHLDPWEWPKAQVGGGACIDSFGEPCFMLNYCKYGPPSGSL